MMAMQACLCCPQIFCAHAVLICLLQHCFPYGTNEAIEKDVRTHSSDSYYYYASKYNKIFVFKPVWNWN